jgi:hypothetical protein
MLELTPGLVKELCDIIRMGCSVSISCALKGIGYSTAREWVLKGRANPDSVFGDFSRELEKAVAESEARDLSVIQLYVQGRPAEYEYQAIRDENGKPIVSKDGVVQMEIAKDREGNPILKRAEIKPTWQAAAWKLERKFPQRWSRFRMLPDETDKRLFEPEEEHKQLPGADISMEQQERLYREVREVSMALEELSDDPFSIEEA